MLILGIETSCDETAAAVVEDGRRILSDVVASQVMVHAPYGGVVPEVASRQHLATVVPTVQAALHQAGVDVRAIDGIAVTHGPGLVGPLLVGVEVAKAMGYALGKPVIGVNHHAGHMAAVYLDAVDAGPVPPYPHVALLVSGGHTALYRVESHGHARRLGATRDDAAGEAFDKVAKVLGLGYPGGAVIDRLAGQGNSTAFDFPRALRGREDLDFSFSGLKTALATFVREEGLPAGEKLADVCASFQAAVVDVLVRKARGAVAREGVSDLVVCGGVAANQGLRAALTRAALTHGFSVHIPPPRLCTDNAAMIAAEGFFLIAGERAQGRADKHRHNDPYTDLTVDPGLPIERSGP